MVDAWATRRCWWILWLDCSGCFLMFLFSGPAEASSALIEALLGDFRKVPSEGRPPVAPFGPRGGCPGCAAAHRDSDSAAALDDVRADPSSRRRAARLCPVAQATLTSTWCWTGTAAPSRVGIGIGGLRNYRRQHRVCAAGGRRGSRPIGRLGGTTGCSARLVPDRLGVPLLRRFLAHRGVGDLPARLRTQVQTAALGPAIDVAGSGTAVLDGLE